MNPPHIYAISDWAYSNMTSGGGNQCIVVRYSGRSRFLSCGPGCKPLLDALSYRTIFSFPLFGSMLLTSVRCWAGSGESGAGKTESAKFVIRQLIHLCHSTEHNVHALENKILQVNPLLEAFGNAQTIMNDNRYG